jgi:hypothetical protein
MAGGSQSRQYLGVKSSRADNSKSCKGGPSVAAPPYAEMIYGKRFGHGGPPLQDYQFHRYRELVCCYFAGP